MRAAGEPDRWGDARADSDLVMLARSGDDNALQRIKTKLEHLKARAVADAA